MLAVDGLSEAAEKSFQLTRGALEPPFARGGRPGTIMATLKNYSTSSRGITVRLVLPNGSASEDPLTVTVGHWKRWETKTFTWRVTADVPLTGQAQLLVRQGQKHAATLSVPVRWHAARPIAPVDYVPPPQRVDTGRYLVGAIHCPLWDGGRRWRSIIPYPRREPVLSWYNEGDPEVTDWEIKWAVDHGISFFLVCWYRAKNNCDKPVEPALEHWLRRGLFQSRYGDQMKFAILYENGNRHFCGETSEADLLENLLPFWLENYFTRSNYLVLDGQPVLAIYNVERFVRDLGGEGAAAAVLDKLRAACRAAGFSGLQVLGHYCWGEPAGLREQAARIQRIGMEASWSYHWPTFTGAFGADLRPTGASAMAAQENLWRTLPQPNILTVSMGWDSQPWSFAQTRIQWQLTPEEFKTLCERAKAVLEERSGDGLASRLVLLDNWNEYGEGHYIFPTREHGFGYLDAVREVFAPDAAPHSDLVPEDIGRGPHDSQCRAFVESHAGNQEQ
jgi:hypothetical protein